MNGEMTMSGRLKGKVSLVTGGELGAATAKALAEQGATFNSLHYAIRGFLESLGYQVHGWGCGRNVRAPSAEALTAPRD